MDERQMTTEEITDFLSNLSEGERISKICLKNGNSYNDCIVKGKVFTKPGSLVEVSLGNNICLKRNLDLGAQDPQWCLVGKLKFWFPIRFIR